MYNSFYANEISIAAYVIAGLIGIFLYLLLAVGYMGIFRKADQPIWAAFVPLYNSYILNKIAFGSGWFFLIGLLPAIGEYSKSNSLSLLFSTIGFLYTIFLSNRIATVFDKSKLFTVGLIFLPFIFYPILGLGSSYYAGQYASGGSFLSTGRSKESFQSDYYTRDYHNNPKQGGYDAGSFYSSGNIPSEQGNSTGVEFFGQENPSAGNGTFGQNNNSAYGNNGYYGQNNNSGYGNNGYYGQNNNSGYGNDGYYGQNNNSGYGNDGYYGQNNSDYGNR